MGKQKILIIAVIFTIIFINLKRVSAKCIATPEGIGVRYAVPYKIHTYSSGGGVGTSEALLGQDQYYDVPTINGTLIGHFGHTRTNCSGLAGSSSPKLEIEYEEGYGGRFPEDLGQWNIYDGLWPEPKGNSITWLTNNLKSFTSSSSQDYSSVYIDSFEDNGVEIRWRTRTYYYSDTVLVTDGWGDEYRYFINGPSAGPADFTLDRPTADSCYNVSGKDVAFYWNKANRAYTYDFAIQAASNPTVDISSEKDIYWFKDKSAGVVNLNDNGERYNWSVTAWNSIGTKTASGVFVNGPSGPPEKEPAIYSPGDGSTVDGNSITFTWYPVYGALDYIFEYSLDAKFANSVKREIHHKHGQGSYSETVYNLENLGRKYYWRVSARNYWGGVENFKTTTSIVYNGAVPEIPVPTEPLNEFYGNSTTFCWDPADRANTYHLQISKEPFEEGYDIDALVYDKWIGDICEETVPNFPDNGTDYYWRVEAGNFREETSGFSNYIRVTNEPSGPPGEFHLLAPDDKKQIVDRVQVDFSWGKADRAKIYWIEISTDLDNFSDEKVVVRECTDSSYISLDLSKLDAIEYFWRVTAKNSRDYTYSYEKRNFLTGQSLYVGLEPRVGSGKGRLEYHNDIDIAYSKNDDKYYLYDMSRRLKNNTLVHNHNGKMRDNAVIKTIDYSTNKSMENNSDIWNSGTVEQQSALDAQVYTGIVYDYLWQEFRINGYDSNGSSMTIKVGVPTDNPISKGNLMWDNTGKNIIVFEMDNASTMTGSLDVIAHEWGHAVAYNIGYVRYFNEAASLHEAFADWFGVAVEHYNGEDNWTIGEYTTIDENSYFVRNLADPQFTIRRGITWPLADYYIDHEEWKPYPECSDKNEIEYLTAVYKNMGVPDKMFYLLSAGGEHHGVDVKGITIEKAMKIAMKACTENWSVGVDFKRARNGMIEAAAEIYGKESDEVLQVKNAWKAVGVTTDHGVVSILKQIDDLGKVPVNTSLIKLVAVMANFEEYPLSITKVTLTNPENFILINNYDGVTLKQYESVGIYMKFSPNTTGALHTKLTIASDENEDINILITGEGGEIKSLPEMHVLGERFNNFESVLVGSSSQTFDVNVKNQGNANLYITAELSDSVNFKLLDIPSIIPPDVYNAKIRVQYIPTTFQEHTATLKITSNNPTDLSVLISLKGKGVGSKISVWPLECDFGEWTVGTSTQPAFIKIENIGINDLLIKSITSLNSENFTKKNDDISVVAPGEYKKFNVIFNPKSEGPLYAAVRIVSNDKANENVDVVFKGQGITPHISVVSPLDFGRVKFNTDSFQQIEITNTGTAPLHISNIVLSNNENSNYRLSNYPLAQTLLPGGSMRFNVIFRPKSDGVITAALKIYSDDLNYPVKDVVLSGVGLAPVISASECRFGNTQIGAGAIKDIQINNIGNEMLIIAGVPDLSLSDDSDQLCFSLVSCIIPMYIAPNSSKSVGVQFNPIFEGIQNAKLRAKSNDSVNSVYYVPIVGYGTPGYDLYFHDLIITNHSGVVSAINTIKTGPGVTIGTGTDVKFKAGNSIRFEPGFTVSPGAKFRAELYW